MKVIKIANRTSVGGAKSHGAPIPKPFGDLRSIGLIASGILKYGTKCMRRFVLFPTFLLVVPVAFTQANAPWWRNGSQEKMCGLGTYHDALDLAFKNATSGLGESLVTVQVLPSFHREYALVLKQVGSEVKLVRVTFHDQLWRYLGPPLAVSNTRQQCLDRAKTAKLDTVERSATPQEATRLWTWFRNINLETDTCPREHGHCALISDGTEFVIQTSDGHSLHITEVEGMKGVRSENPALLEWAHAVLQTAENYPP